MLSTLDVWFDANLNGRVQIWSFLPFCFRKSLWARTIPQFWLGRHYNFVLMRGHWKRVLTRLSTQKSFTALATWAAHSGSAFSPASLDHIIVLLSTLTFIIVVLEQGLNWIVQRLRLRVFGQICRIWKVTVFGWRHLANRTAVALVWRHSWKVHFEAFWDFRVRIVLLVIQNLVLVMLNLFCRRCVIGLIGAFGSTLAIFLRIRRNYCWRLFTAKSSTRQSTRYTFLCNWRHTFALLFVLNHFLNNFWLQLIHTKFSFVYL